MFKKLTAKTIRNADTVSISRTGKSIKVTKVSSKPVYKNGKLSSIRLKHNCKYYVNSADNRKRAKSILGKI